MTSLCCRTKVLQLELPRLSRLPRLNRLGGLVLRSRCPSANPRGANWWRPTEVHSQWRPTNAHSHGTRVDSRPRDRRIDHRQPALGILRSVGRRLLPWAKGWRSSTAAGRSSTAGSRVSRRPWHLPDRWGRAGTAPLLSRTHIIACVSHGEDTLDSGHCLDARPERAAPKVDRRSLTVTCLFRGGGVGLCRIERGV